MSVIVRFAPSPTGLMHVGNARLALVNWLFARKHDGLFWLRMDDTDAERSSPEFAAAIERDLGWLGLGWDRQARQSDRLDAYEEAAATLRASGRLYPAYESEVELDAKRAALRGSGRPPLYDRTALKLTAADRARLEAEGRRPHWRFRLDPEPIAWPDLVHGPMRFDPASLSDPVVIREDGRPLYIFSSVVDDIALGITHVIRGDDHVSNSALQVQLFAALGGALPVFAHLPLLMDADGGKLSKRKGALSLEDVREAGIEPQAVTSLLARLGTADPVEPLLSVDALLPGFDLTRFSTAPARFDAAELERLNARILHALPFAEVKARLSGLGLLAPEIDEIGEAFWLAVRGNLTHLGEAADWWPVVVGPLAGRIDDPAFAEAALAHLPPEPWDETSWEAWTAALKQATGRAGKALFQPLRLALIGQDHGPEMRRLLPLIGRERAAARLKGDAA